VGALVDQLNPNYFPAGLVVGKAAGLGAKVDTAVPTYGWKDIIGPIYPKAIGAGSPTRAIYQAGEHVGEWSFAQADVCDFDLHIPHDYAPNTDLFIHLHWSHTGTTISGNAVFDFYTKYAKGHNQANFTAEKNQNITYATTDVATTPQYRHRIDEVQLSTPGGSAGLLDTSAIEPDGLVLGTLVLTGLPTLGGGGKLFIHFADIHYQSTSVGATKQRAPNFYV
jgi:hypothetical protein